MAMILLTFSLIITTFYFFNNEEEAKSTSLNVYEKIRLKKNIHYLIIGDSIGRGAGVDNPALTWFNQWEELMKTNYRIPLTRHSIVQSGATAFEGLYLFHHAPNKDPVDLIFILFGENDRKYMKANEFAYFYNSLLKKVKRTFPDAEVITITESCLTDEAFAATIKELSMRYETNHIDMRLPFKKSNLTTEQLTKDFVHPNHRGYQLYADAIFQLIKRECDQSKKGDHQVIHKLSSSPSFKEISHPLKMVDGFITKDGEFTTNTPGASISFQFTGNHLGVKAFVGKKQGDIDVWIDQKFIRTLSTKWPIQKYRILYVESHLPNGEHEVTFVYSNKNLNSNTETQPAIQISSIIIYN